MDHQNQALSQTGSAYRFQGARLLFIWAALAVIAVVAHTAEQPLFAMLCLPLVLIFQRLNVYRLLVLLLTGFLVFFPPQAAGSFYFFLFTPEVFAILFVFLVALSKTSAQIRIPINSVLLPIYLFAGYVVIMAIPTLIKGSRLDAWAFDLKMGLTFFLLPLLLVLDNTRREPKKVMLLLLTFVFLTAVHSIVVIAQFLITQYRVGSWNEIFVSDTVIVSAILLRFHFSKLVKIGLWASLGLSILALIAIQTRSLWISTVVALFLYGGVALLKARHLSVGAMIRFTFIALIVAVVGNVGMGLLTGQTMASLLMSRMSTFSIIELADPFSSMGYRLHESWAIWDQRTFFGHGTGATLRLYFTQLGLSQFYDWWSIHSGYFEILHKYGFLGLGIFAWLYVAFLLRAKRHLASPDKFTQLFGGVLFAVLVNHAVVSITTGYFLRWAVLLWVILFFASEKLLRLKTPSPIKLSAP
jgi:hypothetical protein